MNEKLMFKEVIELCKANGLAIDRIANDCSINQNLVAKFFLEVMKEILSGMEERSRNNV